MAIREKCDIKVNGREIKIVDKTKFLGITLDAELNWKQHMIRVAKKMSRGLGMIRKISALVDKTVRGELYMALVNCYITYGILIWGKGKGREKAVLEKVLKRGIEIIMGRERIDYEEERRKFEILNIDKTRDFKVGVIMFERVNMGKHRELIEIEKREMVRELE